MASSAYLSVLVALFLLASAALLSLVCRLLPLLLFELALALILPEDVLRLVLVLVAPIAHGRKNKGGVW
jgi:hypothetical protein